MVTQFVLRSDKQNAAGRRPVYPLVYADGQRLKCALGEKCRPADWNEEKQQFRRCATGFTLPIALPKTGTNIRFDLRLDKADKHGRVPVNLFAFFDGHRLQYFTKEKCKPADWNADRRIPTDCAR